MNLLLLVVLFAFLAWSLQVSYLGFDAMADLTLVRLLNGVFRAVIFVVPVLLYLR